MHRLNFKALMLVGAMLLTPLVSPLVMAKGVYQSGPDFIAQTFAPETPKPGVLWLTAEIRQQAQNILDRPVAGLRVRYHMAGSKTAWILEEIGKEMPITIGIVIHQDKIEQIKILAYRESRGGEARFSISWASSKVACRRPGTAARLKAGKRDIRFSWF